MIRTQIQLPDELYRRAKRVAEIREISLAEMTRRGLELFLDRLPPPAQDQDEWKIPRVDGGGIKVSLERLREFSDEERRGAQEDDLA